LFNVVIPDQYKYRIVAVDSRNINSFYPQVINHARTGSTLQKLGETWQFVASQSKKIKTEHPPSETGKIRIPAWVFEIAILDIPEKQKLEKYEQESKKRKRENQ